MVTWDDPVAIWNDPIATWDDSGIAPVVTTGAGQQQIGLIENLMESVLNLEDHAGIWVSGEGHISKDLMQPAYASLLYLSRQKYRL